MKLPPPKISEQFDSPAGHALTGRGEQGFTLIEIISVLILLGVLAAIAVPRYIDITREASNKAIEESIAELNHRETVVWGMTLFSTTGWVDDGQVTSHGKYHTNLGNSYAWTAGPGAGGGSLSFQNHPAVPITRTPSQKERPAVWRR